MDDQTFLQTIPWKTTVSAQTDPFSVIPALWESRYSRTSGSVSSVWRPVCEGTWCLFPTWYKSKLREGKVSQDSLNITAQNIQIFIATKKQAQILMQTILRVDWIQKNWIEVDKSLFNGHFSFTTTFDWFLRWSVNRDSTACRWTVGKEKVKNNRQVNHAGWRWWREATHIFPSFFFSSFFFFFLQGALFIWG